MNELRIVSYWDVEETIYEDDGLYFIIGTYDHKKKNEPKKSLGIHWGDYPKSHNVLCPCVISDKTRDAILAGLLQRAIIEKDEQSIKLIMKAIQYFQE